MIKPLKNIVAVVRLKPKTQTESGIILQGTADRKEPDRAKVIALGSAVTTVKVGDTVLVNWGQIKSQTTIDDIPTYFVSEENIDGVFED